MTDDKPQAFHYYSESHRFLPSNLKVLSWLGAYYVESELYEQAIKYFEKAIIIEPEEIKWHLMVASCHRRSGNFPTALHTYKRVHEMFPTNIDCLKLLIRICTDLGLPEAAVFEEKREKLEALVTKSQSEHMNQEFPNPQIPEIPKMPQDDFKQGEEQWNVDELLPE
jgi:intraflagellar transport protein 88